MRLSGFVPILARPPPLRFAVDGPHAPGVQLPFTLPPAPSAEYKALRRAVPPLPCRAEDLHVSRWRIVEQKESRCDAHKSAECQCSKYRRHDVATFTLVPRDAAPAAPVKRPRKRTAA